MMNFTQIASSLQRSHVPHMTNYRVSKRGYAGEQHYDLAIMGSGPAGQRCAVSAAKLQKKVALIDTRQMLGGVCLHTGTIPSKTLREAILHLGGVRHRSFYGKGYSVKENVSFKDLTSRVTTVIQKQKDTVAVQLRRNGIRVVNGHATFEDPHKIKIVDDQDQVSFLTADKILIACGTRPARDPNIHFDGKYIVDSDQLLQLEEMPHNVIVVGAGVIGLEYASMLSTLRNIEVTVIDQRPILLDFADREMIDILTFHMRDYRTKFRLGEKVKNVYLDEKKRVVATLESGKRVLGDVLLYAVGRQCNTDQLMLKNSGLEADKRGKLAVNDKFQTKVPHIYAAGDVIGFPALASASMTQGRIAASDMFGVPVSETQSDPNLLPYGIYTIPEISLVGKNEQQLTAEAVPYEYGVARYSDVPKGMMLGDETGGLLKILFHRETLKVLGVHCIGEAATEIIHIGQSAIALGLTIDYFGNYVFNSPSFSEAYQMAAIDGLRKI